MNDLYLWLVSKWTANCRPGVLRRSAAYQAFMEQNGRERRDAIGRQNWKYEQIDKLKKQRAIAARLHSRADTITAEGAQQTSNQDQPKTSAYSPNPYGNS